MTSNRRIYSAVGSTPESARAQIEALGPASKQVPAVGEVPVWDGYAWVPDTVGGGGGGGGGTTEFSWFLPGLISDYTPSPSSFYGMDITDPALTGPGPFDGSRRVPRAGTLTFCGANLRIPTVAPGYGVFLSIYVIQAGLVDLVQQIAYMPIAPNNFAARDYVISKPVSAGDILFVSTDNTGPVPVGAADLSVYLQLT